MYVTHWDVSVFSFGNGNAPLVNFVVTNSKSRAFSLSCLLMVSYRARLLPEDEILKHNVTSRGQSPHRARTTWRGNLLPGPM